MKSVLFNSLAYALILFACGCQDNSTESQTQANVDYRETSITEFHNLGWLGAKSHPLLQSASFEEPSNSGNRVSPGGLVIREVLEGGPAQKAGLVIGDVIVGVQNQWVPIKDDPTIDFIEDLESQVSLGQTTIELQVLRNGNCDTVTVEHELPPLDEGLPFAVTRFAKSADKGLKRLAAMQNEDGSFGSDNSSADAKLQTTALAGLALLSANDRKFSSVIDYAKKYLGEQIDLRIQVAKSDQEKEPETPTPKPESGMVMKLDTTAIEMEPLTASYVLSFITESNIRMMDRKWMPRQFALLTSLRNSQHESGGWNVKETEEEPETEIQIEAAHVTNQVVLALGMLERTGMMMGGGDDSLQRACSFLSSQMAARSSSSMNPRLKASLNAGTAAALLAVNCQQSDPVLADAIESTIERAGEIHLSPSLTLPGVLSTAIVARQTGKQNWLTYHSATRYWKTGVQGPKGRFNSFPLENRDSIDAIELENEPAWVTAHYCLVLTMQSAHLEKLTAQATPPTMIVRNSAGEKASGPAANAGLPPGIPEGAQVIQMDLGDIEGGDIQEAIRKKLKERGIDIGDGDLNIQGLESGPIEKRKDDKKKD